MGKRSRNRSDGTAPARPARSARSAPREKGLGPVRRVLAGYLIAAALVGVLTLTGIALLGGSFGPALVLVAVVALASVVSRTANVRLAGANLSDEDRVIQTMAGGMLVISIVLAVAGVVLSALV